MNKLLVFLLPLGLKLLGRLSSPVRKYIESGFDKLIALAKEKTATTLDENILSLMKVVLIGGIYESGGTGKMETILEGLTSKLTPLLRKSLYDFLSVAEEWAKSTSPIVDDITIWFVKNLLFPDGDPGGEGVTIKGTEEVISQYLGESGKAPGSFVSHD